MDDWSEETELETTDDADVTPVDPPEDDAEWGDEQSYTTADDGDADPTTPAADPDDDWEDDSVSAGVVIGDTGGADSEDEMSTDDGEDNIIDDTEVYPDEPSDYTEDQYDELA